MGVARTPQVKCRKARLAALKWRSCDTIERVIGHSFGGRNAGRPAFPRVSRRGRNPFEHDEAEGVVVRGARSAALARHLAPFTAIELRKPRVGIGRGLHFGKVDAV